MGISITEFALKVLSFTVAAHAIILKPIRPYEFTDNRSLRPRVATQDLDLRNEEILLWGRDDVLANFTVYTPGDSEGLLNMERFDTMLQDSVCTNTSVSLTFIDNVAFEYATGVWDWVNGADNHSFILIVGAGDCGWNDERQPFTVTAIEYEEGANTAHLSAQSVDFSDILHTFDLHVGQDPNALQRRGPDWQKGAVFDVTETFSPSLKLEGDNIKVEAKCDGCGTTGALDVQFDLKTTAWIPHSAQIRVVPKQLKVPVPITFTMTDTFPTSGKPKKTDHEFDLLDLPLPYSIDIPKALHIGPILKMGVKFEISNLTGSATLSTGWTAVIPDDSLFQLDLLDRSHNTVNGWNPDVQRLPTNVNAKITAGAAASVTWEVSLEAEVIKKFGYEVAVELEAPKAEIKLSAIVSSDGICKKSDGSCSTSKSDACGTRKELGVQIEHSVSAELKLKAGKTGGKPFFELPIGSAIKRMDETVCFLIGKTIGGSSPPSSPKPSPSPGSGSTLPPPSGGTNGDKCTMNSGLGGVCQSTSSCSSKGGFSEAGHCPGGTDNQCCAVKTCKTSSGVSGTCKATSSCNGVSTPGLCPGAANIQCCTPKASVPPATTCKANGIAGTCMSTASCKSSGKISTPGHCPGAADIQCCTPSYGTCKYDNVRKGDCLTTASCDAKNGIRKAGLCPGPSNIQCCTIDYGQCTVDGTTGACIASQACHGQGGIMHSGKCPGAPLGITCCTGGA